MQDAILLTDPRGRAQISKTLAPNAIAPTAHASMTVNPDTIQAALAQSEQHTNSPQNSEALMSDGTAHAEWSAHIYAQARAGTTGQSENGNIPIIETITHSKSVDISSIDFSSNALSDPRAEILSPHFQRAEQQTPALNEVSEIQLLGPDGSRLELPVTSRSESVELRAVAEQNLETTPTYTTNSDRVPTTISDTVAEAETIIDSRPAHTFNMDDAIQHFGTPLDEHQDIQRLNSNGLQSEVPTTQTVDRVSDLKPKPPMQDLPELLRAETDLSLNLNRNEAQSQNTVSTPINAVTANTTSDTAHALETAKQNLINVRNDVTSQTLSTNNDTNALNPAIEPKTAMGYIKSTATPLETVQRQSSHSELNIDKDTHSARAQDSVNVTGTSVDVTENIDGAVELDPRTVKAELATTNQLVTDQFIKSNEVLENNRLVDSEHNSSDALAKDLYVKTGEVANALGLSTGLAQVTDTDLTFETTQFSLSAAQALNPAAQTAASLAMNPTVNAPVPGPNTVAMVSEAMLRAKETSKGVTVQLDPPEMGRVYIDFIFEADRQVNIVVKTETLEAQHMLRERSDDFLAMLKEEGLDGATLSFEFHDNQGFEGFDDSYGSEPSDTPFSSDDSALNPSIIQSAYTKTASYTDGLDLRL